MKQWFDKFWQKHGDRIVFGSVAAVFGIGFYLVGWTGEGKTILIGLGMLAFNKCRSGETDQ